MHTLACTFTLAHVHSHTHMYTQMHIVYMYMNTHTADEIETDPRGVRIQRWGEQ